VAITVTKNKNMRLAEGEAMQIKPLLYFQQRDMHQYRPCTNELCKKLCNHDEAECGQQTRRACVCNTHQLVLGLGRKPDPGEINCDIACRHGLFDAMIMDVTWEVPVDGWGVKNAKYCGCVRPVSLAIMPKILYSFRDEIFRTIENLTCLIESQCVLLGFTIGSDPL